MINYFYYKGYLYMEENYLVWISLNKCRKEEKRFYGAQEKRIDKNNNIVLFQNKKDKRYTNSCLV